MADVKTFVAGVALVSAAFGLVLTGMILGKGQIIQQCSEMGAFSESGAVFACQLVRYTP